MKHTLYILILISNFCYSQVGIGTNNPSAILHIVSDSNTNNTYALKIKNSDSQDLFKVSNTGNLDFKRALYSNNQPGQNNYILESQGANASPIWVNMNATPLNKYVVIIFNGTSSSYRNGTFNKNVSTNIVFDEAINTTSPSLGVWNASTKDFTVSKDGIYEITAGVKVETTAAKNNRKAIMSINTGGFTQLFEGSNVVGNQFNTNLTGKVSRYLTAGTKIAVNVTTDEQWRYSNTFLNINYSEKTN